MPLWDCPGCTSQISDGLDYCPVCGKTRPTEGTVITKDVAADLSNRAAGADDNAGTGSLGAFPAGEPGDPPSLEGTEKV